MQISRTRIIRKAVTREATLRAAYRRVEYTWVKLSARLPEMLDLSKPFKDDTFMDTPTYEQSIIRYVADDIYSTQPAGGSGKDSYTTCEKQGTRHIEMTAQALLHEVLLRIQCSLDKVVPMLRGSNARRNAAVSDVYMPIEDPDGGRMELPGGIVILLSGCMDRDLFSASNYATAAFSWLASRGTTMQWKSWPHVRVKGNGLFAAYWEVLQELFSEGQCIAEIEESSVYPGMLRVMEYHADAIGEPLVVNEWIPEVDFLRWALGHSTEYENESAADLLDNEYDDELNQIVEEAYTDRLEHPIAQLVRQSRREFLKFDEYFPSAVSLFIHTCRPTITCYHDNSLLARDQELVSELSKQKGNNSFLVDTLASLDKNGLTMAGHTSVWVNALQSMRYTQQWFYAHIYDMKPGHHVSNVALHVLLINALVLYCEYFVIPSHTFILPPGDDLFTADDRNIDADDGQRILREGCESEMQSITE